MPLDDQQSVQKKDDNSRRLNGLFVSCIQNSTWCCVILTLRVSTLGGPFCAGTAKARLTARITRYVKAKTGRIALLLVGISQIRE